jgi:hypothetical protein
MITTSPQPVCLAATSLLRTLTHSHQLSHAFYIASILFLNTVSRLLMVGGEGAGGRFDTFHVDFCLIHALFVYLILKASFKKFIKVKLIKYCIVQP